MFVLREINEPIKWPVEISRPLSGGKVETHGFTAHLMPLDTVALGELSRLPDAEFIIYILLGWEEDLVDEQQQPIPFSPAARDKLARTTWIKRAILAAYQEMLAGLPSKNSSRPGVTG